jgi:hypothetical protein
LSGTNTLAYLTKKRSFGIINPVVQNFLKS